MTSERNHIWQILYNDAKGNPCEKEAAKTAYVSLNKPSGSNTSLKLKLPRDASMIKTITNMIEWAYSHGNTNKMAEIRDVLGIHNNDRES